MTRHPSILRAASLWLVGAYALAASAHAQESLFPANKTGGDSGPEGQHYELGMIFRPTVNGTITHLRVYALAAETGAHSARLWRNGTDTLIAGPFAWTYGGAAGWVTLDIPDVPLTAATDYTVVVSTGGGGRNYPFIAGDLTAAGGNGAHLTHPANAGVFTTAPAARPTAAFNSANYLRDVVFVPDPIEPPADAPVRINELLAENKSGITDEDGETSDWIELYNPKAVPVALGGYVLTDGTGVWTFPSVNIGAQGFIVVFASAKNRVTTPMHTSFKLDGLGESLVLRDATGAAISTVAFPSQRGDTSYGRGSAGNTGYMTTPTPGGPNIAAFDGLVADTVFSVRRGFFTTPQSVSITTATPGATIRYTLDGSTPTETSAAYTAPLTVAATTTLRARAFRPDFIPTNTDTNTYIFAADVIAQTDATTLAYGWPPGPINSQVLRYGMSEATQPLYTQPQKLAALAQIPTLSIVTDQPRLTGASGGIYVNATTDGLEHAASLELIHPDGAAGFQVDAGLRIRGGQSRQPTFPKHSFNLFFRREYGAGKLNFPMFGADGAREFDTLSIRCEHGYAYADPHSLANRLSFTAMRDVMCRDLWAAAGFASTRSRFYHLLLNGQYWGLYQTQERAQEDFGATYFGGTAAEYDGVAATGLPQLATEATAGDLIAWTQLWSGARAVNANPTPAAYFSLLGKNADGTRNPALPVLLDPRELAAYMLVHYYTGHADAPLSVSFGWERPNNFRALRRRGLDEPWHFFVHDGESSLAAPEAVGNRANAANLTSPNRALLQFSNPEWMHEDLLASAEYRIAFADEAQRLLLNGGAFTAAKSLAMWNALAAQIDAAVVAESLRWAQTTAENQANWAAEVDDVRTQFFPTRSANVIAQLRQRAIFPGVDAPAFSQRGGQVATGFTFTLTAAPGGVIYFTLNGSDPRAIGGAPAGTAYIAPVAITGPTLVRARYRSAGGEWSALDEVFFTTFPPATSASLIVSKIHYHPPPPSPAEFAAGFTEDNDFEYLELQNRSAATIDLRGVQVNSGVAFSFASAAVTTLAPGARVLIVENPAAFAMRYGAGLPVAGAFLGNLSDGGELLRIVDGTGVIIAQFTYDDAPPWPTTPDGSGLALVLKATAVEPANAASWRPSYVPGGKPGLPDDFTREDWRRQFFAAADLADAAKEATLWGDLANPDRDDAVNLVEYALGGTSPISAAAAPRISVSLFSDGVNTFLRGQFRIRDGIAGFSVTAQASADLLAWTDLPPLASTSQGDNTTLVTVQNTEPLGPAPERRFLRVKVTATP